MYDLVLKNARIIDGCAKPEFVADLGIKNGLIENIGEVCAKQSKNCLDLSGLVLAPGFIDVHTHADGWLLKDKRWDIKVKQGYTTEVLMADGISYAPVTEQSVSEWIHYLRSINALEQNDYRGWKSISDYLALLDKNCLQNVATHVPYANVRTAVCGFGTECPKEDELKLINKIIRESLEAGAVGLSTGLEYLDESLASSEEIIKACSAFSNTKALYVTHIRYPIGLLAAMEEAVKICEQTNVPLHVSHLKAPTQELAEELLAFIENEACRRVDFSFDVYPYAAASTMLHYLLPFDIWKSGPSGVISRLGQSSVKRHFESELKALDLSQTYIAWVESKENSKYVGKSLKQYQDETGGSIVDAATRLLIEENLSVLLVFRRGGDEIVHQFLSHDNFMLGSDGVYFPNAIVHPRCFGSAARLLGDCVRKYSLFSLEVAVQKMTSIPAKRFGLSNRGEIRKGFAADFCVFNPDTIADKATYDKPEQFPEGIESVFVNGELIVSKGKTLENAALAGQVLSSNLYRGV